MTKKMKKKKMPKKDKDACTQNHEKSIDLRVDSTLNSEMKVGGDISYNFDNGKYKVRVSDEYKIDASTTVKGKLENFNTLSLGLTHNYRKLVNFGFVTRLKFDTPVVKEGDSNTGLRTNIKTKFGLLVEFNDTLA